jgi:hypothetical protein
MSKLKLNEERLGAKHMYASYKKANPDTDVTYAYYRAVLESFSKLLAEELLNGAVFNMGQRLGTLRIKKIKRSPNARTIDWNETLKMWEEQGKKEGFVYWTDDTYYRWAWDKRKALVKNKSAYRFDPTGGKKGLRKKLTDRLRKDPFAGMNYSE